MITGTLEARTKALTPLEAFDPDAAQGQSNSRDFIARQRHLAWAKPIENSANELACWLPLLHWLHEASSSSLDLAEKMQDQGAQKSQRPLPLVDKFKTVPALVFRNRS